MDTYAILTDIQNRLKSQMAGVGVELYPEKPSTWRLNNAKGALLIDFRGGQFGQAKDTQAAFTERTLTFGVSIVARTLYKGFGGLDLLDKTRTALNGYCPPNCKKLLPKAEKFIGEQAGLWIFEATFETQTIELETFE